MKTSHFWFVTLFVAALGGSIALCSKTSGAAAAPAAPLPALARQTHYEKLNIDGIDIFYRDAGPKNAPAVLLLHGFPTSSHMFRDLIPKLADKYRVIAPDYAGFARYGSLRTRDHGPRNSPVDARFSRSRRSVLVALLLSALFAARARHSARVRASGPDSARGGMRCLSHARRAGSVPMKAESVRAAQAGKKTPTRVSTPSALLIPRWPPASRTR